MTSRRPALLLNAVLVALTMMLSGCVSIPASGPAVAGRTIDEGARPPRVKFFAIGPVPGDSPISIVRGFLRAAADFSRDHSVARSFLTPDKRTTWRPDNPVVIYGGAPAYRQTEAFAPRPPVEATPSPQPGTPSASLSGSPDTVASPAAAPTPSAAPGARVTVEVQVSVQARIRDQGLYLPAADGEVQLLSFHLIAVERAWRITNPEDGVVISRPDFEATFSDVPLYFRDLTGEYLVPDVRWFPVTSTPTVVVSALLDGPAGWLNAAVTTGAPSGTGLTATGVRSDRNMVVIDLTRRALEASPEERQVLLAQLRATLRDAAGVLEFTAADVQLTVEQARLEVPVSGGDPLRLAEEIKVDPRPVALDAKGRINRLTASRASPVAELGALSGDVSRPGVSLDGTSYAVLTEGQRTLVTLSPGRAPQVRLRSAGLSAPSFDVYDWVWTSPTANTGVVYTVRASGAFGPAGPGATVTVAAPWLRGFQVTTLRISREGARALVVATHQGEAFAFVCGVVREQDGTPTALTDPPLRLVRDLTAVRGDPGSDPSGSVSSGSVR